MDTTDRVDRVHSVPVPERYLPVVYGALADAYRDDAAAKSGREDAPVEAPIDGDARGWTEDEVVRAYRESTPRQRAALEYLADHPDIPVRSRELATAVYPDDDPDEAEGKLYGLLGAFGRRVAGYGKKTWFFDAARERLPDGERGYFVYEMPAKVAAWVRKASGPPELE